MDDLNGKRSQRPTGDDESIQPAIPVGEKGGRSGRLGMGYELEDRMFHIVNSYTRAAQYPTLSAESGYRLQKVGGNILAMLN